MNGRRKRPLYSADVARTHLNSWIAAELALSTGQSYSIAGRSLTRADISTVMKQIKYWQSQLDDAEGYKRPIKSGRFVPFDL
ncbi:hypothetical protein D1872_54740 [compost metagenome]